MAKKKNTFGKLFAFTTTAVAIGGICYIYHDKIKQNSIYKTISGKFSNIFGHISNEFCDNEGEDFFFDEEDSDFEDAFSKETEHGREYTSITINAKEDSKKEAETAKEQDTKDNPDHEDDKTEPDKMFSNEDLIEIFPKDSIANIKVGNTSKSEDSVSEKNISSTGQNSYENEGLSDVSEDPDTLESQDKLDI